MMVLKEGDHGQDVLRLQLLLNKKLKPSPKLTLNGAFEARTLAAVVLLQTIKELSADGVVGVKTWLALGQSASASLGPPHMPIPGAPWVAIAQAEHGIAENSLPGKHTERIVEYHATTTLKATADETAWCSSFVNWVMIQSGRRGTNSAAAMSWLEWGKELPSPRLGAVVVIKKKGATSDASTGSTTGYHVGFASGIATKSVTLLGGNQLNRVNYRNYSPPVWEVKGWRWPLM